MKGYTPNFNVKPKAELNSKNPKNKFNFIELGVLQNKKCEENCECEQCIANNHKQ